MIGRMLSAGLDTNPIIVDYSYDMPKYLKEQYLGIFVKYTGNNTDEYKNGYTYQVSQKQNGTDTVYFFAPYFYLESLASSADTSKIIDGYQAYNDNGKKIVGQYKTSEKVITENGTFYPADDSINAYSKVTVNVAGTDPGVGTGDFWVKVIDYDGTVLFEKRGNNGDSFDLPSAPSHEGLVFQEWSASCPITDGKVVIDNNNIMAGAIYTTASGQNEFDITLTKVTGLSVTLNMDGTKDWGDGTSDTNTTHTYSAYGDYTIKCDGTTITSTGVFGQSSSTQNYYCIAARFATVVTVKNYAFQHCYSLGNIVFSNEITSIEQYAFSNCYSLTNVVFPNGVTSTGSYAFTYCYSLTNVVIPNGVTSISEESFSDCFSLTSVVIPNGIISIGSAAFFACYSLVSIIIPNGITSIGNGAFSGCCSLKKYDLSQCSIVPILSNTKVFLRINAICKIIVPDSLYDEWIAAANWSTYADYIYKASEVTA